MLFRGRDNVDEFDTFQNSLLTMFNFLIVKYSAVKIKQSRFFKIKFYILLLILKNTLQMYILYGQHLTSIVKV